MVQRTGIDFYTKTNEILLGTKMRPNVGIKREQSCQKSGCRNDQAAFLHNTKTISTGIKTETFGQ